MANTCIAYECKPEHKHNLVKMVKTMFPSRPMTLAIGDGLNDVLMLQTADISFELVHPGELLPVNAGDIKIADFSNLK